MKTKVTLIPAIAASMIASSFTATSAEAPSNSDLVRFAHRIEDIANDLKSEFRTHFRHSGAYNHLMTDLSQIKREIIHIDELAHTRHPSLNHLAADVEDLDKLAHHLHDVVDAVERGRYRGHVDGDICHVHSLLKNLNRNIHSMEKVIEDLRRPVRPSCAYERRRPSTEEIVIGEVFRTINHFAGHRSSRRATRCR